MIVFCDTSAIVKRYLHETGSNRVRHLLQRPDTIPCQAFVSSLEITSAFYRRHRSGEISLEDLSILLRSYGIHSREEYLFIPYSQSLVNVAQALISRHPLRALDSLQLASAMHLRAELPDAAPPLVFVSADDRLIQAAAQEHLRTENPERAS
ncbi:MAG TPA: type II toxin-antitoxin system VapC family toxin [Candidatus Binatia bacterium]